MYITFVMPGSARVPVGGYKVAFEYANGLAARGHQVTLIFPALLNLRDPPGQKAYHMARYLLWGATNLYGPQPWFGLGPGVNTIWVPTLAERFIPRADAIVATGWPTAEFVAGYSADKGQKYYLIQHLETWWGDETRVLATWRLPLRKIVIARWLGEIAEKLGEDFVYIPNGLDFSAFRRDTPIGDRDPHTVMMLYHRYDWKGSSDGIEALKMAQPTVPRLRAFLFGVFSPPAKLPGWIEYI